MNCYGLGESLYVDPDTGLLEVRLAEGGGLVALSDGLSLDDSQKQAVWSTWTPTLTNMTQGSGTVTARYFNQGGLVMFSFTFTLGAGSAMGSIPEFSLPVTPMNWGFDPTSPTGFIHAGMVSMEDNGVDNYQGICYINSTLNMRMQVYLQTGTYGGISTITSAVPFTWGSGDTIQARGWYRAA